MQYSLLKKQIAFFAIFCLSFSLYGQNNFQLPKNTVFYMEVNGKLLNKKMNWAKFNPVFNEVLKKENKTAIWNDYSKTGVKYDDTQFHYFEYSDSVKSYNAHFILDDEKRFVSFINSAKKEGLEITKKAKYSYVSLDNNTFIAWNDKRAVLKITSYSKPYKYDDDLSADSTSVVVDSAYVDIVPPNADLPEIDDTIEDEAYSEKAFNYKEEIEYLEEDLVYLRESVKSSQAEIEKIKKDIAYLKKHHKYPEIKQHSEEEVKKDSTEELDPPPPVEDEYDEDFDDNFKKKMDSIDIADFKIVKEISEGSFDEIFNSNFIIEVPKDKTQFRDAKADLFAYTNFGSIFTDSYFGRPMGMGSYGIIQGYLGKLYNSDSSYNLYFDQDKVKLTTDYRHKDPAVQKSISDYYKGNNNRKLSALLSDKSIGYFAMNLNGYKSFDATYDLIENMAENQEYKKEVSLMVETMKIVLDEKAISKIIPGNAIFILNDLNYKKVEYTDYEYDEEYNEKEIKKTKDAAMPDFTFAFVTENEGYWSRLFDMLATNKETSEDFVKKGKYYEFKNEDTAEIEKMIFAIKDGIVYITTSEANIGAKTQSANTRKYAKEVSKHSLAGWFNAKKLVVGLEKEFKDQKDKDLYHLFRNKTGEMTYKVDANSESIQSEMNYHIDDSSENSLMYFFDLFDDIYKIVEPADKYKKL